MLDLVSIRWGPVARCCEESNEHVCLTKYREFNDYVRHNQILKKGLAPRSYVRHNESVRTIVINNFPQRKYIETRKPWCISRQWNKLDHNLISAFLLFILGLEFLSWLNKIAYWKATKLLPQFLPFCYNYSGVFHSVRRNPIKKRCNRYYM
jgi:hypothetical protein